MIKCYILVGKYLNVYPRSQPAPRSAPVSPGPAALVGLVTAVVDPSAIGTCLLHASPGASALNKQEGATFNSLPATKARKCGRCVNAACLMDLRCGGVNARGTDVLLYLEVPTSCLPDISLGIHLEDDLFWLVGYFLFVNLQYFLVFSYFYPTAWSKGRVMSFQ